jgi:alginate O-acetyltransferase complex protein AlgI
MNFTSPLFLFLFLPLVLGIYWLCPPKLRSVFALIASLFFYAWGEGIYVVLLCLSIATNYLLSLLINRCQKPSRRLGALSVTVALNLAVLLSFKYPDSIILWAAAQSGADLAIFKPLHLPLGISFFTFQAIAFAVDIYRQQHTSALNPVKFSLFLSLFPKISAGPIIRYEEIEDALRTGPTVTLDTCAYGAKRFIIGMGKKLIIADALAKTADQIFAVPAGDLTAPMAWLGIICYTLQLYFDFAGYSDMAIGLGRMLGFSFRENFDYPYIAKSLTEFWRRWHLSLSTWFRDYLYTPLLYSLMTEKIRHKIALGQYRTNYRSLFCIIVVFTLCGWWHGPTWNYVIWGLLHGLVLAVESWKLGKILKKAPAVISHSYTMLVIMLCWVFFRSPTVGQALSFIKALAGLGSGTGVVHNTAMFVTSELLLVLVIATIAAMPVIPFVREKLSGILPGFHDGWTARTLETGSVMVIFFISLLSVANATYNPFIYFRF